MDDQHVARTAGPYYVREGRPVAERVPTENSLGDVRCITKDTYGSIKEISADEPHPVQVGLTMVISISVQCSPL